MHHPTFQILSFGMRCSYGVIDIRMQLPEEMLDLGAIRH